MIKINSFQNENATEKKQLADSIDKLFHYLLIYSLKETDVVVADGNHVIFQKKYNRLESVTVSPTLFRRIDACHGAGNCCRVPFDLVYTYHDLKRIHDADCSIFGVESEKVFNKNRSDLLESLERVDFYVNGVRRSDLFVKRNRIVQQLSGNKSCPYLFTATDRYLCGAHPFKPLHCWYPHMTVRSSANDIGTSVSIGRMQYGRNHKFGCPVIFTDVVDKSVGLFSQNENGVSYFETQYQEDLGKLKWTADSTKSLGISAEENLAVTLDARFAECVPWFKDNTNQVDLWRRQ